MILAKLGDNVQDVHNNNIIILFFIFYFLATAERF
jgi:hypothetical protein